MNKCSVFFVLLCSLPSIQLSAQLKDTSKFHFQMPAGVQYVTSSTWKPYQLNYLVGLSGMNKLSKHKPFID